MKKLSVCFIAFNFFPGQGLTGLYEYSRNLRKLGHEVYVIAAGRQNERKFEIIDEIFVIRIRVKTTKKRSFETLRFSLLASRVLSKMLKRKHIDIVHIFTYAFSVFIKLGVLLSFSAKNVKWVYDVRSGPIEGRKKPTLIYHLTKKLLRFESNFFDAIFVINEHVKNVVLGNSVKKETFIAPLGADFQLFKKTTECRDLLARYDIKENDVVLVYLGNLNPERKLRNLILAFWKAYMKIKNLKLLIIGEGEELNDLKLLTEGLSISDKVLFLGYVKYAEVPRFLSITDIAISYVPIISAFDAQPPVKTVEYLACSLPVIATDTKGNKRFIVHEWNGLLTKDDPDSLSKAIVRLAQDANLRATLSRNARSSVKNHDWKIIVKERILPAYQKILKMQ